MLFGRGYWIYTPTALNLTIKGVKIVNAQFNLTRGWNLIGGLSKKALLPHCSWISPYAYTMIIGYSYYIPTQILLPSHAHWLLSSRNGTITVNAQ